MNEVHSRINKLEKIIDSLKPFVPDYSSIINKPSINDLKINSDLDVENKNIKNVNCISTNIIDKPVIFKNKPIFEKGYSVYGNITNINLSNLNITDNKLILSKNNQSDQIDFGFVGKYNSNMYSGLIRDVHDNGKWKLFSGINQNISQINKIDFNDVNINKDTLIANLEADYINVERDVKIKGKLQLGPGKDINQQLKIKGGSGSELILTGVLSSAESKVIIERNESNGVELKYKNDKFTLHNKINGVQEEHIIIDNNGLHLPTLVKTEGPNMISGNIELVANTWYKIAVIHQNELSSQIISLKGNSENNSFVIDVELSKIKTKAQIKKITSLMQVQLFNRIGCIIVNNTCYLLINHNNNTNSNINYELWCDNKFNKTNRIIIQPEMYNYQGERFIATALLR